MEGHRPVAAPAHPPAGAAAILPGRRRPPARLLGYLAGVALTAAVAGVVLWLPHSSSGGRQTAAKVPVSWQRPVVSKGALAERSGVKLTQVAVTGDGGLVDVRYQVFDPDKANTLHEDATPPALVDEQTGLLVSQLLMGHSHHGAYKVGVTYYLVFENPGNLVHRGAKVSVLLGNAQWNMWSSGDRRAVPVLARAALAVAGALLCLTVPGHPAAAHAVLVGSDPPDGATLTQAPRAVELRFGEDVSPRFSSARLVDRDGRPVGGTAAAPGRGGPRRLVLGLPALGAGTYGVLWQVLAEDDGHTTRGVVVFSVGAAGSRARVAPAALGSATSPADVARRWLGLCLLAGLVGALAVALALGLGGPGGSRARPEPEWRVAQQSRAVAPRSTEGLGGSRSGEEGLRRIGGPTPPYEAAIAAARRRLLAFAAACAALGAAATSPTPPSRPPGRRRPPARGSGPRSSGS